MKKKRIHITLPFQVEDGLINHNREGSQPCSPGSDLDFGGSLGHEIDNQLFQNVPVGKLGESFEVNQVSSVGFVQKCSEFSSCSGGFRML